MSSLRKGKRKLLPLGVGGLGALALLLAALAFRAELAEGWLLVRLRSGEFAVRERALESLAARRDYRLIRRVLSDGGRPFQMRLRDANHFLRKLTLGREWTEVEWLLSLQRTVFLEHSKEQHFNRHVDFLGSGAVILAGGFPQDVRLEFWEDRRDPGEVPQARPGKVMWAEVQVVAQPGRPYQEVIDKVEHAGGEFVDRALRHQRVEEAVRDYPIVSEINVTYRPWVHHRDASGPWVFCLRLDLEDGREPPSTGTRLSLEATSHLDGLVSHSDEPLPAPWRVGEDVLEEIGSAGSSTWTRMTSGDGK